ncbi:MULTISPECIES: shikimate dehydrogenase [Achromobacter]|uniref:Shikimate dehydrogenase (NADP(+)) n=1 Tax=Achromobacter aegrifaciens TaxID=1287736 RepID=A0AAD2KM94_ACHAE|nr:MULTISPECIES: shikimate dehydrogenase [Achromobacter]MBD9384990.1 shikimate dehydrogenase [Achromobacter sp. ACM02]MDQ1759756.1 shikimate dehydrogenase [Achromobacter aegrifaciens]MDR7948769.1 shikimate dehydrogenase [Achromobacter aegrifaciens]RIJ02514.1 shikimate dehydrogenase [Achromobacter sp. K91]CAB3680166.1 Shikimate dehydrogenase (NADP(+)) [Achromobacter aegrifaciens]
MTEAPPLARYAVIGNPIAHSRSPQIHAMFAEQTGKPLRYERLLAPVDGFAQAVAAFVAEGGLGLNVTVPFKLDAYALAAGRLSSRARLAGAVNTLSWRDGAWHGCNTDGVGLVSDLLRLGVRLTGASVLLVGAGGAARGVLQPLAEAGCARIHIVNRTASKAEELAASWRESGVSPQTAVTGGSLADAALAGGWNLVINATASGLQNAAPDLPPGLYAPGAAAYDMMYGAQPTAFMQQAQADGAALAADGLGMLVGQAAESFYIWHGVRPDPAPVLAALREALKAGQ